MALETGAFFSSYQEFQDILKKNEDECGVLFVKASSKKLRDESPYLERLQYQQITFTCKQGHRTRTSTSQGIRPNQKTLKTGCPAFIRLVEDRTTCKLKVASCHLVHENHPTGKEFSQLYPEPSSSVSSDSVGAAVLPTLSEPSSSVSSDSVGAAVLPTLSEPSSSVSSDSVGAAVLPTLSEPSSSVSSGSVGADFSIPASSSAASSCGFSNVKMSLVKTKGRPRQVQAFTRRHNKRKTCPQDFHSRSCEEKKQMLLSGCLLDSSVLPPYSVSNLKSPENILSVFANESISLSSIEHLFVEEAWVTLQARIEEKIKKELFSCNSCANRDDGEIKMIECEGCLEWYHYQCVGVRTNSKPSKWFCVDCWR